MTQSAVQSGYAAINGAKIYFEIGGEGMPVVFVHAGICDLRMWDDQMTAFTPQYRVLRYDQRGFGQTKPVEGKFSDVGDLLGLLDLLNINRAVLVGCSMGGNLSMDFTLLHPERVRALVMVGSSPSGYEFTGDPPPIWQDIKEAWEAGDLDTVNEYEVQVWVDGESRTPDQVPAAVRDKVREMNLIALKNEKLEIGEKIKREVNAASRLNEINIPVLAIIGDLDDAELVAAADLMVANAPNVHKIIMAGTAHVPSIEKPAEFNRHLLTFLQALE